MYEDLIKEVEELCKERDVEFIEFITEAADEHVERYKQENI